MARAKKETTEQNKKNKKKGKSEKESILKNIASVFKIVAKNDPVTIWWMVAIFIGTAAVSFFAVRYIFNWITALIVCLPLALLATLFFFSRRAERAMYRQVEDQPGVTSYILSNLGRGWTAEEQPVTYTRHQDLVFRAIGRPGVFLISEGPHSRVRNLLTAEKRRLTRILPNVPIYTIEAGKGKNQVPIAKLQKNIKTMPKKISRTEIKTINNRLASLNTAKPPIPQGIDPNNIKPNRRALRGR